MFEFRFGGQGELAGHNLGNLMLRALDHLSVRPLEAINLVRSLLKVDAELIPMSEHPVDLAALDANGEWVHGEVNVDKLTQIPRELMLQPEVSATREAILAIKEADLVLIGPGSFYTSLMPLLLMKDLTQALRRSRAHIVYIGNLGKELSVAAASLTLHDKLSLIENQIGRRAVDAAIVGPKVNIDDASERLIIQTQLEASDIPYRHDRELLRKALEEALQKMI
jgi:uncharacterized cofD-like protein